MWQCLDMLIDMTSVGLLAPKGERLGELLDILQYTEYLHVTFPPTFCFPNLFVGK